VNRWISIFVALVLQIVAPPATAGKRNAVPSTTAPAQRAPASGPARGDELAALERKLLGTWKGRACAGDYTFDRDGTFKLEHFTPGGNTLTGTWSLRWDALPPTLVLTCETSDFRKKDSSREEYEFLGKPVELKLVELSNDTLGYRSADPKVEWQGSRRTAR
jgi:hypothetical protein